ncbi:class I SAM-dependent methyltransferase [Streptomyces sp. NPDC056361]|uniref:class I SAM-dependent methyltransferase n=1 Tax=Streptomyces sp. NPDC056361 TaxID=3345795 RepID=UPI0035E334F3
MTVDIQPRAAAFWDRIYSAPNTIFEPIPPYEIYHFQDRTGAAPGQTAVDIGTGLGEWANQMAQLGMRVTGYDCSPVAINRARELHRKAALDFVVHDFDLEPIPRSLRAGSVDVLSCRHSLHFLDVQRFLVDVRRWLRRDGVLHITTAVTDKMRDGRNVGMSEERVRALLYGWREHDRYDVASDGSITALVLRGPHG